MPQTILTIIVVAIAVIYAIRRVYLAFQHDSDPCAGCTGCSL